MPKWKTVRVKQELVDAVKRALEPEDAGQLSEFVTEAIQMRLAQQKKNREVIESVVEHPIIIDRLLYSSKHIWAMVTPQGDVRVGLSDYAQARMDGITGIHHTGVGSQVKKDEPFGAIETWMFKFDLFSPITGKIANVNKNTHDDPTVIRKDPYGAGWIAEIRPIDPIVLEEELRDLMKPQQYKTWVSRMQNSYLLGT